MPALNFQKQFAALVESGKKRQTIRAYRADGRDPSPGQWLFLYTGMRTKSCRRLGEAECDSVENIRISADGVRLGGTFTRCPALLHALAEADGFASWAELVEWFGGVRKLPFSGLLIRW
jgi:hypothetical protein